MRPRTQKKMDQGACNVIDGHPDGRKGAITNPIQQDDLIIVREGFSKQRPQSVSLFPAQHSEEKRIL
jgi:hypothetical protein